MWRVALASRSRFSYTYQAPTIALRKRVPWLVTADYDCGRSRQGFAYKRVEGEQAPFGGCQSLQSRARVATRQVGLKRFSLPIMPCRNKSLNQAS